MFLLDFPTHLPCLVALHCLVQRCQACLHTPSPHPSHPALLPPFPLCNGCAHAPVCTQCCPRLRALLALAALLVIPRQAFFRRAQLRALVGLHSSAEGLGGNLSADEISIITGALDLTSKTAWAAMTPLDKVGREGAGIGQLFREAQS